MLADADISKPDAPDIAAAAVVVAVAAVAAAVAIAAQQPNP